MPAETGSDRLVIDPVRRPKIEQSAPFFLLIGSMKTDAAVSKLKTGGVMYRQKRLESTVANWKTIVELLEHPHLIGVIAKMTSQSFRLAASDDYEPTATRLFAVLGTTRHVVLVHESILRGEDGSTPLDPESNNFDDDDEYDDTYYAFLQRHYFHPPAPEVTRTVVDLFQAHGINFLPYTTNAELSVIASAFVDENEKNLLFRVYIPNGRIYAEEADKLLSLFRDWLLQVKRLQVRQDGYTTASGRVYEFYGEELGPTGLSTQFDDFTHFLDACVTDPEQAERVLRESGVDELAALDIVRRYGKEGRRLQLDLKQAREAKLLSIRHRLESELIDIPVSDEIDASIQALVPPLSSVLPIAASQPSTPGQTGPVHVTINQQIIGRVEGVVAQATLGTAELSADALELLRVIREFGGSDRAILESAVHELEDGQARNTDRLVARQRLKAFLYGASAKIGDVAFGVLQSYIEKQIGV
jgi:hypothetical protein